LPDPNLQEALLCEPDIKSLTDHIQRYLERGADEREDLCRRARLGMAAAQANARVVACYDRLAQRPTTAVGADLTPLVSVVISYYNLPEYLPETLDSLARQDYPNFEVIVVDDGSTSPSAKRVFEEEAGRYPHFRFISQANAGTSAARNRGLHEPRGEFFLCVDADNVAHPDMISTFVRALVRNRQLAGVSSFFQAFRDANTVAGTRVFDYAYRPTGGPFVIGALMNVFGDANSMFRTADVRAVAGFVEDSRAVEDWELFVRLIQNGFETDVIPRALFDYRHREQSMARTTDRYRNRQRVLRHYERGEDGLERGLWFPFASLYELREAMRTTLTSALNRCDAFARDRDELLKLIDTQKSQVSGLSGHAEQLQREVAFHRQTGIDLGEKFAAQSSVLASMSETIRALADASGRAARLENEKEMSHRARVELECQLDALRCAYGDLRRHCENLSHERAHYQAYAARACAEYNSLSAICRTLIAERECANGKLHRLADRLYAWIVARPRLLCLSRHVYQAGRSAADRFRRAS
jgi:glycosyltransferase involved in cell wall biosynthesis